MLNLIKSCMPASRLSSRAISKSLPLGVLSSKTFISNTKTPFFTTPIRYSFWEQNIHRKDQGNQSKYVQQLQTFHKSLNIHVSKLQSLLKSLKQQEEQLDTAFLQGSQEKPSQQVIEIVGLVKALKSKTIQIERSVFEVVQLMDENKINKWLLQLFNLMQKKCQQRTDLAERALRLASKLSKDEVDPKLVRIFEYLGGVKQQGQIKDSLTIAYTTINNMDINTNNKNSNSKYFLSNQQLSLLIAIISLVAGHYYYTSNFEQQIQLDKKALQQAQQQIQIAQKALQQAQQQVQIAQKAQKQSQLQVQVDKKALKQPQRQSQLQVQQTEDYKEKALAEKHRNVVPIKEDAFLVGSKIEDEIKKIIDIFSDDKVKMIVGCPGVGKSAALKKILNERKENSEFFFFTLQSVDKQADRDKAANNLLSALYGLQAIYGDSTETDKKIKIIIDDINRIEKLTDPGLAHRIMTLIYAFGWSKSLDLICISSSGTFIEALQFDSQHKKSVKTFILQSEHSEEFINGFFVTKLQQKYLRSFKQRLNRSQTFWKKFKMISKQIFDYGFTLRFIEDILCDQICDQINKMETLKASEKLDQDKQQQNQMKEILQIIQERKSAQDYKSNKLISGFNPSNLENYKKVLRLMNQQKQFNIDDCLLIGYNIPLFSNMVDYLNKHNLIMFCRPRTKKERAAFEHYIKNSKISG